MSNDFLKLRRQKTIQENDTMKERTCIEQALVSTTAFKKRAAEGLAQWIWLRRKALFHAQ